MIEDTSRSRPQKEAIERPTWIAANNDQVSIVHLGRVDDLISRITGANVDLGLFKAMPLFRLGHLVFDFGSHFIGELCH